MVGRICFGPLIEPEGHHPHEVLPADLCGREILTLVPLAAGCLVFGLFPTLLLDAVHEPVNQTVELVQRATGAGAHPVTGITSPADGLIRGLSEGVRP